MPLRILLLLIFAVVVVMTALELLADYHPGVWWTHKQAHIFGGLAVIGLVIVFLVPSRD